MKTRPADWGSPPAVPGSQIAYVLERIRLAAEDHASERRRETSRERGLAASVEQTNSRLDRLVGERRRLNAEPLVDEAIATGAISVDERETVLRRFEVSPELAQSELDDRDPDRKQAYLNRVASTPSRELAERQEIARYHGLKLDDVPPGPSELRYEAEAGDDADLEERKRIAREFHIRLEDVT